MSPSPTPSPPPPDVEPARPSRPDLKVPVAAVALVQATAEEVALQRELDALAAPALPGAPIADSHEDLPAVKSVTSSLETPPPSANDDVDPLGDLPPPPGIVTLSWRRPLPHVLPKLGDVLDAIAGDANIHAQLLPAHQKVVALFPTHLLEAVRTHVTGNEDPLAIATANAWRALIVDDLLDRAFGVDQPALQVLVDEAADAREKVLAAALFSLDGAETTEPLAAALATAIERLTERVKFKAVPRKERPVAAPRRAISGLTLRERLLRGLFLVVFFVTAAYHLAVVLEESAAARDWVVVGDPELGHAVLAPGNVDADNASLEKAREELRKKGFTTTLSPMGEWVITRSQEQR